MDKPTKEQIRAARKAAGLTQEAAGAMVHHARRTWQDWELGHRAMDPAVFELFQIKTGQISAPSPQTPPARPSSSPSAPPQPGRTRPG